MVFRATLRFSLIFLFFSASFFPFFANADAVPGGFPAGSIWLSKTVLVEGDSVTIFTPIYNASDKKVDSDVVFLVDGASIGSVHVSLGMGETKIASLSWSAKQGTHTMGAQIQNAVNPDSKEAVALSSVKAESLPVTVAAPPPPTSIEKVLSVASSAVSASLPAVSSVASAVFAQTENVRTGAVAALQQSLASDAGNASAGSVAGASASNNSAKAADVGKVLGVQFPDNGNGSVAAAASTAAGFSPLHLLKQILLFLVSYTWIFYPLLLILFLLILYFIGRQLSRRQKTA